MSKNKALSSRKCEGSAGESTVLVSPTTKVPEMLDSSEDEEEEIVGIEEEMVEEMMRWLEHEISAPPTLPSAIGANQESCGPSISDSTSTVMASIDTRAVGGRVPYFCGTPGPEFQAVPGNLGIKFPSANGGAGVGDEGSRLAPSMSSFL